MQKIYHSIGTAFVMMFIIMAAVYGEDPVKNMKPAELLKAGRAALDDHIYPLAENYFNTYINKASSRADKADGVLGLAEALYEQGEYKDILALLDKRGRWARTPEAKAGYVFWRGMAVAGQEDYPQALTVLEELPSRLDNEYYVRRGNRLRARCYAKIGDTDRAITAFKDMQKSFVNDTEAAHNLLDWAGVLIELKHYKRASSILERLLRDYAELPAANTGSLWLGQIYLETRRLKEAENLLMGLLTRDNIDENQKARVCFTLASVFEAQMEVDRALEFIERGNEFAADPILKNQSRLYKAKLLIKGGRQDEGGALLHEWIAANTENPRAPESLLSWADELFESDDFEKAHREYQYYLEAFSDTPGRVRALMGKGWCLLKLQRYAESVKDFEKAYALADNDADKKQALFKAADAHFANGGYTLAREKYLAITQAFPASTEAPQALFQAAESLAAMGQAGAAEKEFQAIEDAYANSDYAQRAILRIAALKEDQEAWEEAIAEYNRILRNFPNGGFAGQARHGRALINYRLGDFEEALSDFDKVIQNYPEREYTQQAFYMRGWALYLMGDSEKAQAVCREFMKIYPDSAWAPDVLFWLAEYHFNLGLYDKAESGFVYLTENYPGAALADDALFWAGRSAAARKEYLRAIEHYSSLAQGYSDSSRLIHARFAQGDALSELGQFAAAILAFEEVIKKVPDSYMADLARGRIGDCHFTLGADDPSRYAEAMKAYNVLIEQADIPFDISLQAEYKLGRCSEKAGDKSAAFDRYMSAVYRYISQRDMAVGGDVWFTRAAFNAAAIKEQKQQWPEAISIYERVIEEKLPAAEEARLRIKKIRLEHWVTP